MALVSISEAARLVGKSRRTLQRDIVAGKLSKCDNGQKLDTSELLRVYGAFLPVTNVAVGSATMSQDVAGKNETMSQDVADMRVRLAALEAENAALKDHLGSLKQAMLLLENKASTEETKSIKPRRRWWQIFRN
ncbi:TPA: DNA-binding protein [Neisseria subflava]|jgi:hypothetical protein|uniref:hypothetical protein n=1 Tax=Neisseria TaxID=482 RepID=UPI0008A31F5D|nr:MULTISPECIES: hypothetical protein [Neisseria]OFV32665.1 hypothetical protein HMPREF3139_06450 [Neisseria sp. HMSC15G01]